MGDEFDADGPVRLKVLVHGTRPIARVDIIKDFVYVYSTEPKQPSASSSSGPTRRAAPAGLSWYYVRVIQDDGELAWGSPIWVRSPARPRPPRVDGPSGRMINVRPRRMGHEACGSRGNSGGKASSSNPRPLRGRDAGSDDGYGDRRVPPLACPGGPVAAYFAARTKLRMTARTLSPPHRRSVAACSSQ